MIAKLNIFTKPISVFSEDEQLVFCPCFVKETSTIFVLVSNKVFSLLYRVEIASLKKPIEVNFEQIITIKLPKELLPVNKS